MTGARHLLLLDGAAGFGGHQEMTAKLLRSLADAGRLRRLSVVHGGCHSDTSFRNLGVRVELHSARFPRRDGLIGTILEARQVARLARSVSALDPDLILANPGGLEASGVGVVVGLLARRPTGIYLPMVHSIALQGARLPQVRDRLALALLRGASRVAVLAASQRERLAAAGIHRVDLVHNPVPSNLASSPRPVPGCGGPIRVAVVGRVDLVQKGQDRLVRFVRDFGGRLPGYRFAAIGDGPDVGALDSLRSREGVDLELRPWDASWTESVDVLLITSRFEGLPLVLLQALAAGIPVVSTPVGGCPDLLPADFVVPDEPCQNWVDALERAVLPESSGRMLELAGDLQGRYPQSRFAEEAVAFVDQIR
jgi:glycosyltransferase involved in cell wall biosynthesis